MIPIYKPYLPSDSLKYAHQAIDSGWLSSHGKYLSLVQEKLQELHNVKYALPLNNGTSACHLVSKCLKRKLSPYTQEMILVSDNSYVAAWNSLLFDDLDFYLVPVKTDLATWNMDLADLEDKLAKHSYSAVQITHNIGNIINVPDLQRRYPKTLFIEDNCEGFLGKYEGVYAGTESLCSAISFYGNKSITCGEGGAMLTNDEELYAYAKCIQSQGQSTTRFVHNELGYNYRMTNIQAALLYGQLEILPQIVEMKEAIFERYRTALKDRVDVVMQEIEPKTKPSNWMFGVRVRGSTYAQAETFFQARGVEIRPMFYPITAHAHLDCNSNVDLANADCTIAERLNRECLILPSYPELTGEEQSLILGVLDEYVKEIAA